LAGIDARTFCPEDTDAAVQDLLDKQAIAEVLYRCCRGCDRKDRIALETIYWPDATDPQFDELGASGWIERMLANARMASHFVSNVLIDKRSPTSAGVESYVRSQTSLELPSGRHDLLTAARYLDGFEKRGHEWRIKRRICVIDYFQLMPASDHLGAEIFPSFERGATYPRDALYRYGDRA
jgi:hypothetical protein